MEDRMESEDQNTEATVSRQLRCLAIGSGKGGVGKTVVSVGLSMALVEMGYRVLLFDADLGLANVDLQIGVDPVFTLQDVVYGECPLEKAVISVPDGPDLLAASSGAREMVSLSEARREILVDDLIKFSAGYDFLIIDTEAGIGAGAIEFLQAMPQVHVVVANEPTSVMDAYSLIKILSGQNVPPEIRLVINSVKTEEEGQRLAMRLNETMKRFLGRSIETAGIILYDAVVGDAIRARRSVVQFAPQSAPAIGLRQLAHSVVSSNKARNFGKPVSRNTFGRMAAVGRNDSMPEEQQ
ncbi:MinD/ParA family protein [Verrucomicrobia bacterium S94]|nr:MinD/ParA family protein [Verrucomicrobia bacterium S94]